MPSGTGQPLETGPRIQEQTGERESLLVVNSALLERAAAEGFAAVGAGLAKNTITDNAITVVDLALRLSGNYGLTRRNPLERHYRNVLCGRVHSPQQHSAWLRAGRQRLEAGLP